MGLKWFITGGCGFIGTSLIKSLISQGGHSIRVLDNLSVGSEKDLRGVCHIEKLEGDSVEFDHEHVQLIVGDILSPECYQKYLAGSDVVVHLAANTGVGPSVADPMRDCKTNVEGTLNVLEAARKNGCKRFVFASSGAPVGECEPPIHEDLPAHPVSPYGASKLAGEGYCSAYYKTFGIDTVALRFSNVYGPLSHHKNSVVATFIQKVIAGEELEIFGDGNQTRDFIYIGDLIEALFLAATAPGVGGQVYQIATNEETTINDLIDLLAPIVKKELKRDMRVKKSPPRLGDVMRNFSDTTKARTQLGWEPRISLEEGLTKTVRWYLNSSESGNG